MAIKGYNTLVEVMDSLGTYREVAKAKNTDIYKSSRGVVDTTTLRSPGGHTEKDTTLRDTMPLKLDVIYDDTSPSHSLTSAYGLQYLFKFDVACQMRITLASGKQFEYLGKITDMEVTGGQPGGIIEASVTFTPTQAPISGA